MDKNTAVLRNRFLSFIEKNWIQNNHSLEDISCVYVIAEYDFMQKDKDISYVGSTTKLFSRYKSHKIPALIQQRGHVNILYYLPMMKGFYDYEIKLIKHLQPIFNKQHKNGT